MIIIKTKIFYFSATGNSLFVAQRLEENLKDAELISISKVYKKELKIKEKKIGIITPIYAWGLPRIVSNFLSNIEVDSDAYIFAIATCGGTPGNTLLKLNDLLRNNNLNAGFVVNEGSYTFLEPNLLMKIMINISGKDYKSFDKRSVKIIDIIKNNKNHDIESSKWLANKIGGFFHNLAIKEFKDISQNFWTNDKCINCGKCIKVCPRDNIILKEKPTWKNNCESCFACIQWCPEKAIEFNNSSIGKKRMHNNNIEYQDMIIEYK